MVIREGEPTVDGRILRQRMKLSITGNGWVLWFDSRSGPRSGSGSRNPDYAEALRAAIARISTARGLLECAYLASSRVVGWGSADRELPIAGGYPRALSANGAEALRADLCRAQAASKFRTPGSKGSGTAWKRIELVFSIPGAPTNEQVADLVFDGVPLAIDVADEAPVGSHVAIQAARSTATNTAVAFSSKQAIYDAIHDELGLERRLLAPGGTPHAEVIDSVASRLNVQLAGVRGKVARARLVVEACGGGWVSGVHDSTASSSGGGGNITSNGMLALLDALKGAAELHVVETSSDALARGLRILGSAQTSGDRPCKPAPRAVGGNKSLRVRDVRVVADVLRGAEGVCELCGKKGPFQVPSDIGFARFLEVHHVVPLADDGSDRVENAVAVCPNCHRALHHARDREARRELLYERVSRLIRE